MKMDDIYSFIGLIQKSGKLFSGDESVEISIRKKKCNLIIITEDASDNTKNKFIKLAKERNIPFIIFGKKKEIGVRIGKPDRAVLGIQDINFANGLIKKIQNNNGGEYSAKN